MITVNFPTSTSRVRDCTSVRSDSFKQLCLRTQETSVEQFSVYRIIHVFTGGIVCQADDSVQKCRVSVSVVLYGLVSVQMTKIGEPRSPQFSSRGRGRGCILMHSLLASAIGEADAEGKW
jgi:hypothetical protein